MQKFLSLDTIQHATSQHARKWTPALCRNQSRDVLDYLLSKLYDLSPSLVGATLTLSQAAVARKLKLSREWVGKLYQRLQAEGWIEYYAPVLSDGHNGPTLVRIGRRMKWLLVRLRKAKQRKTPAKCVANNRSHF